MRKFYRPLGVRGMYMEGLVNVYHNTVYLNCTTGGSGFGSSCIFSSTDEVQVMRNNVLYNASTKGDVKALTRSTGNLSTYNASSNYNLYYAGVPSATNLIYASHDNTHQVQTLSAFHTLLADNRDLNSYSETMQFVGDILRPAANNYKLGASIVGFEYDIAGVLRSTPRNYWHIRRT